MRRIRAVKNIGSIQEPLAFTIVRVLYFVRCTDTATLFQSFLACDNFVSRNKEYRADELACLVTGVEPFIPRLEKDSRRRDGLPAYWNTEVVPVLNQSCIPLSLMVSRGFLWSQILPFSGGKHREGDRGRQI